MSKCKPATKAELAWCERLEKVLKAHPKGLWLFAGDGLLHVMKTPPDEQEKLSNYSIDPDNSIYDYLPDTIRSDGGGW